MQLTQEAYTKLFLLINVSDFTVYHLIFFNILDTFMCITLLYNIP